MRYFADKEAVYSAILQDLFLELRAALQRVSASGEDAVDRIAAGLSAKYKAINRLLAGSPHAAELYDEQARDPASRAVTGLDGDVESEVTRVLEAAGVTRPRRWRSSSWRRRTAFRARHKARPRSGRPSGCWWAAGAARTLASDLGPGAGLFAVEHGIDHPHVEDGILDAIGQGLVAEHGKGKGLGLLGILVDGADDLAAGEAGVERHAGVDENAVGVSGGALNGMTISTRPLVPMISMVWCGTDWVEQVKLSCRP